MNAKHWGGMDAQRVLVNQVLGISEETGKRKAKLSACCGAKLVKRTGGRKGYCCFQCGFVAAGYKWEQLKIDMK